MKRILVTRPEPGATRTSERLKQLGYEPIKLPLTEMVALEPKLPHSKFDVVVATSAQAFLRLPSDCAEVLADVPTFVVGSATAAAARQVGFHAVQVGGGDVEALIHGLSGTLKVDAVVLYLCGRVRRPDLEQALALRGAEFEIVEIYDTKLVSYSTDKLKFLLDCSVDAVLLTSAINAVTLIDIMAQPEIAQAFDKSLFICLSSRIANALKMHKYSSIVVCPTPDENGLMDQLAVHCPR